MSDPLPAIDRAVAEMENLSIDIHKEQIDKHDARENGEPYDGPACDSEAAERYQGIVDSIKGDDDG